MRIPAIGESWLDLVHALTDYEQIRKQMDMGSAMASLDAAKWQQV